MKKAFTLIELLVVIAVIALLSTLSVVALSSARAKSRDARRLSDIKQIQTALEMYLDDAGIYPTSLPVGSQLAYGNSVFLTSVPGDPMGDNQYNYAQTESGYSYTLDFALETKAADYEPGNYQATPSGIMGGGGGSTPPQTWVCGDDLIDGEQTYSTIGKGDSCFMTASVNNDKNRRCLHDDPGYCKDYGGLYEFGAGDALCPSGWRLPKDSDEAAVLIIGQEFNGYYDGKEGGYREENSYLMLTGSDALDVATSKTVSDLSPGSAVSVRCVKDPS